MEGGNFNTCLPNQEQQMTDDVVLGHGDQVESAQGQKAVLQLDRLPGVQLELVLSLYLILGLSLQMRDDVLRGQGVDL